MEAQCDRHDIELDLTGFGLLALCRIEADFLVDLVVPMDAR